MPALKASAESFVRVLDTSLLVGGRGNLKNLAFFEKSTFLPVLGRFCMRVLLFSNQIFSGSSWPLVVFKVIFNISAAWATRNSDQN
jgi:hypothetical protein